MVTTASPPPNNPSPTHDQESDDDQDVRDAGIDSESHRYGLPGEEWVEQIRQAVKDKVYDEQLVRDVRTILK